MENILTALLAVVVLAFVWYVFKSQKEKAKLEFLNQTNLTLQDQISILESEKKSLMEKNSTLLEEKINYLSKSEALEAKLAQKEHTQQELLNMHLKERAELRDEYTQTLLKLEEKYKQNLIELKQELEQNLQKQNTNILNQNKLMLNEDAKKILEEIFLPVKKSVKEYSEKLAQNETSIKTQIEYMFKFSQNMGENADKLAKVLKGDKKIRGNFAELQLKSVLENSGLVEGVQYKLQERFQKDGKTYIPDAVVLLDKQKSIIIDAKFSLPSDFGFEEVSKNTCLDLAYNLKARIDELAKKPYMQYDKHTYEFVLLFIPYQNILDLILSVDFEIYQYAYKKKVYLTTPNTLFMALNTINISWKNTQSNENILKAFEELGKFHDKFAGVLEDFEKIKDNIKRLNSNVDNMQTKLTHGSGNIASRVIKLKELGAKTQKLIACEAGNESHM
ncbi:DNA recombination protein [Campylobacter subantarcticus LMG 24377]|uniref:DNA recombination protein RmuC n=1 Tax=Campylobacter subantarcticus TaxID=497724 RepID=A0ABW9N2S0_9BACT|nr:DNA recombination protein RmuC [Campylobacter subantarcticus]AJC93254.1 DNA recombination protein [Campylobacter subantarcticus LMG 24377]EAL3939600.1 DNA recombination protein RmuC [Campylobacter lari]MPB98556.1 DNA recombination protein RmuC [Campylobacter subantarcticus]